MGTKIPDLTQLTTLADADMLVVEDADGSETKYILASAVKTYINTGLTVFGGHINGLKLSNDTDADHDVNITAGRATDSSEAGYLVLASEMTKQLDAAWVAGDDNGGLFTGAIAASTWYHVFLIEKDADSTIDAGFDTSVTAANIPGGYTKYRRIGSVLTDSSSNILAFTQNGDEFKWTDPIKDIDDTNFDTGAEDKVLSVPPDVTCIAMMNVYVANADGNTYVYLSDKVGNQNETPDSSSAPLATFFIEYIAAEGGTQFTGGYVEVRTNTAKQIRARTSRDDTTLRIATLGYIDRRGQDD